jgi:TetR/AcrR family transcriptional regulator
MAATPRTKRVRSRKSRRPGRPRADDTNQRERLLDAAVECFTSDGIAAASLRSIAIKAGVTPALVHYYFGSKERLLDAFVAERLTPLIAGLGAGLDLAGDDPRTLVASFVRGLHAAVEHNPWLPGLWLREVIAENGALRAILITQIAPRVARVLARRFAALRQDGALSAGVDPRLLVVSLVGLTMFPLAAEPIWRRVFDAADIDRAALERHTLALLDHGLGGGAHAR